MSVRLKSTILEAMHEYLKNKGFSGFRSKIEAMEDPEQIKNRENGNSFVPDMTAQKDGINYIFEVELGDKLSNQEFLEKCKALHLEAKKKTGKLYLVVPVEKMDKTLQIINKNNLENVGILQINIPQS